MLFLPEFNVLLKICELKVSILMSELSFKGSLRTSMCVVQNAAGVSRQTACTCAIHYVTLVVHGVINTGRSLKFNETNSTSVKIVFSTTNVLANENN